MLFLIVLLLLFYFYIDCDFVTFFYHLYRLRFVKDGYYDKTIWIVGASSGIGEELAYEAVRQLAKCVIISARRENELNRVQKECKKIDGKCKIIVKPLDLLEFAESSESTYKFMESQILNDAEIDDIDILVLNSGVTSRGIGLQTDLSVFTRLYKINVLGVFSLIQAFTNTIPSLQARYLRRAQKTTRRGSITNNNGSSSKSLKKRSVFVTSSLAGKIGSPGQAAYCMSKHAINGLLEAMRVELFEKNVHIGIICPGPFELSENSLGGIGNTLDQASGRKKDKTTKELKNFSKLTLKRLTDLYTTCIICNLSESWMSNNPQLLFVYLKQYLPAIVAILYKFVAPRYMKKLVAGMKKEMDNNKNNNKQKVERKEDE